MSIESALSIAASVIAIGGAIWGGYKWLKKKPLTALMNELADKNTSLKRQHNILRIIDKSLALSGHGISSSYISNFHSDGRSKSVIFHDICNKNAIEPTSVICHLLMGYDEPKFRSEWISRHIDKSKGTVSDRPREESIPQSTADYGAGTPVVYMSELLASKFPDACKRLTDILTKHGVPFAFLKGTKDIWCRDYMPVQTPSGHLIQFKYNPSYLQAPKYSDSRSDVAMVDNLNGLNPVFSNINLDGGNVVMKGNKAIITDRIFSENPDWDKEKLVTELSRALECDIIIIPAYKTDYDFTGHADGMIRFIDSNTVLVNDLEQDFKYMKNGIVKALDVAKLKFVNFPFFEYKDKEHPDTAIGIYINYLEVGNLIVMPVFGVAGNKDAEAFAKLKEVFPDKTIETIDYNEVAREGGVLNCTTWTICPKP
ncbi:MAG: agmatine deiminase family protein [Muribaculaceae bacterium]|nr:agmatine deiminase family protein [Muribaculaceae bacterium]